MKAYQKHKSDVLSCNSSRGISIRPIYAYLIQQNRVFYNVAELSIKFTDYKSQLNQLYIEGKIKVHEGLNGKIIEVIYNVD